MYLLSCYLLQSEEARIARELEAHEKRMRKELKRQDILRRKAMIYTVYMPFLFKKILFRLMNLYMVLERGANAKRNGEAQS